MYTCKKGNITTLITVWQSTSTNIETYLTYSTVCHINMQGFVLALYTFFCFSVNIRFIDNTEL